MDKDSGRAEGRTNRELDVGALGFWVLLVALLAVVMIIASRFWPWVTCVAFP